MNKSKIVFYSLVLLILFNRIFGQQEDIKRRLAECAAIKDNLKRLECYDRLARELGLVKTYQIIPVKGTGKWITKIEKNPLDDTKTVILILQADEGESSFGDPIFLVIRCMSNKTELYINWNSYLGLDSISVTTRIGNDKPERKLWNISTDHRATFYPTSPILFIKNLINADKLVAQTTPYGENPIIAIFDIRGLNEAIKPIQETCGWK